MTSSEGGALSALQIAKHGRDRYPTPKLNAEKLVIEAAELLGAIHEHNYVCTARADIERHTMTDCPLVRAELADVGLCLYALGNKIDIDPIVAMRELVDTDQRSFA